MRHGNAQRPGRLYGGQGQHVKIENDDEIGALIGQNLVRHAPHLGIVNRVKRLLGQRVKSKQNAPHPGAVMVHIRLHHRLAAFAGGVKRQVNHLMPQPPQGTPQAVGIHIHATNERWFDFVG